MVTVSLFWGTNMAIVTSCENALLVVCTGRHDSHVGGQDAFLSSANETLFSCKFFEKKFYPIDPQHGRLAPWLQTKNITYVCFPLGFHRHIVIDVVL